MAMLRAALESRCGFESKRDVLVRFGKLRHEFRRAVDRLAVDDDDLEPVPVEILVDQLREGPLDELASFAHGDDHADQRAWISPCSDARFGKQFNNDDSNTIQAITNGSIRST